MCLFSHYYPGAILLLYNSLFGSYIGKRALFSKGFFFNKHWPCVWMSSKLFLNFCSFVIIKFPLLNRSLGILKGLSAECSCLLGDFAQTYSLTFFCIPHTARESRWKADLWISLIVCRAGGYYICLLHYWLGFCSSCHKLRTWFKSKR